MNLPHHRQIIAGRTHGAVWRPTDSDPIQHYPATANRIAGALLAVFIGIVLAMLLVHHLAK